MEMSGTPPMPIQLGLLLIQRAAVFLPLRVRHLLMDMKQYLDMKKEEALADIEKIFIHPDTQKRMRSMSGGNLYQPIIMGKGMSHFIELIKNGFVKVIVNTGTFETSHYERMIHGT